MEVRIAKKDDIDKVSALFKVLDTVRNVPSDVQKVRAVIKEGRCFVVEDEGKVVAAMTLKFDCDCYEIGEISSKKKGAGRLLIAYAIERCRNEGVPKLWCWSLARYKAKGFYTNMGFEEQCLLKKQGFGEDCYFFGKLIN